LPSEAEPIESLYSRIQDVATSPAEPESHKEISSATEAAAYMQQVALKLRNWRESLEKTPSSVRRDLPTQSPADEQHR
jgi:hypothetical protein